MRALDAVRGLRGREAMPALTSVCALCSARGLRGREAMPALTSVCALCSARGLRRLEAIVAADVDACAWARERGALWGLRAGFVRHALLVLAGWGVRAIA
jgi:hypothetical protein